MPARGMTATRMCSSALETASGFLFEFNFGYSARLRSDTRSFRLTLPRSLAPTPAHAQAHSYPNPTRVQTQLVSPCAGAHSHGACARRGLLEQKLLRAPHLSPPSDVVSADMHLSCKFTATTAPRGVLYCFLHTKWPRSCYVVVCFLTRKIFSF